MEMEIPKPIPRTRKYIQLKQLPEESPLNNETKVNSVTVSNVENNEINDIVENKNEVTIEKNFSDNVTETDNINDEIQIQNSQIERSAFFDNGNFTSDEVISNNSENSSIEHDQTVQNIEENKEDLLKHDIVMLKILRTDCLQLDREIRHPSVLIHILNLENNGQYLEKSRPEKNVSYVHDNSNFILPVMTRPYDFMHNRCLIPKWEEWLTFNEISENIIQQSVIIFFEIVDFIDLTNLDDESHRSAGWHRKAWAFLKPVSAIGVRNIAKTVRLQLYKSHLKDNKSINDGNIPDVYRYYIKKKWEKYPSTLFVRLETVSSSEMLNTKPQQRSHTPFQGEIGSDSSIKSLHFLGDDVIDDTHESIPLSAIHRLGNINWARLPGQSCRMPNAKSITINPDSKGCLAVKFSNSGLFLACGTIDDVFVYAIDGVLEKKLNGHQGIIYSLFWHHDDNFLVSASADCTCCIWDMSSFNEQPFQVLSHPGFVYSSIFLKSDQTIITACYDGTIRVWRHSHTNSKHWIIYQELTETHEKYVNCLCSLRINEFFSGDACGVIIHWASDELARWYKVNVIKLIEIQNVIINKLVVFPGDKRLLIHTRDSLLRTIDIKSSVIIQWYQGNFNDSLQCGSTITPCGNYVFANSEDGTVNVWQSNTGKHLAFYSCNSVGIHGCGGSLDFHRHDNIFVFSIFPPTRTSGFITVNVLKYVTQNVNASTSLVLYLLSESNNDTTKSERNLKTPNRFQ